MSKQNLAGALFGLSSWVWQLQELEHMLCTSIGSGYVLLILFLILQFWSTMTFGFGIHNNVENWKSSANPSQFIGVYKYPRIILSSNKCQPENFREEI